MLWLKLVSVLMGALLAFALAATNALASLPDISITLSGTYPLHIESTRPNAKTSITTAAGVELEGTGLKQLVLVKELSALGTFTVVFSNVHLPNQAGKECNSEGDAKGVVLMTGEFHLVPFRLTPPELGILHLITTFIVKCE